MSRRKAFTATPSCVPRSRSMPGGAEIALVAFLVVALIAGGTTAHAQETGEQEAVRNSGAKTAEAESGSGGEEAAKTEEEPEAERGPIFVPIPIFITEPTVGYGLGAAIGYFHKKKDGSGSSEKLALALTTETADVARGPEDWVLYIQIGHAW